MEANCVQKDDTADLLQMVLAANAILYGTPLHGHSFCCQLKLLMKRHVVLLKYVVSSGQAVEEMEILSFIQTNSVGLMVSFYGPKK